MSDIYESILTAARSLHMACSDYGHQGPKIQVQGRRPFLPAPSRDTILPPDLQTTLSSQRCAEIIQVAMQRITKIRHEMVTIFDSTLLRIFKVEGVDDQEIEMGLCQLVESRYALHIDAIRSAVLGASRQTSSEIRAAENKRGGTFSSSALDVLEEAYSHSTVLTTLECRMVAQAAGITHQQVRTWFQNKRNRANRARRNASTSVLDEKVAEPIGDPRRVISGLPKRAGKVITDDHIDFPVQAPKTDDRIRVIRELPKRGIKKEPSSYSSSSSLSSIDSTSPPDIFHSPLDATSSQAPDITFPSAEPPAAFTLPTFPPVWSTNDLMQSPLEMGEMIWSMGETNQAKIQTVLDRGLTLGPSPSFSSIDNISPAGSGMDDTPSSEISLDLLNYDGLDNDEFLSMLSNIVSSGGIGETEDLFSGMEGEDPFADISLDGMFGEMTGLGAEVESLGSRGSTPSLTGKPSLDSDSLGSAGMDISMEVIVSNAPVEAESQEVRPRVDRSPSLEEFLREHSPVIAQASESTPPKDFSSVPIDPALQMLDNTSPSTAAPLLPTLPLFDPSYSAPIPQLLSSQSQLGYPQYQYPSFPIYPAPAQQYYYHPQVQQAHLPIVPQPVPAEYANGWIANALPFDNAYAFAQTPATESSRKGKWVFVAE